MNRINNGFIVFIVISLYWIGPIFKRNFSQIKIAKLFELKFRHPEMANKIAEIISLRNEEAEYLSLYHWLLVALTGCILLSNGFGKTSKINLGIFSFLSVTLFYIAERFS